MEYTSGDSSWIAALRRIVDALRGRRGRRSVWSLLVPIVALLAGLLFTTTATTSRGTSLREDRTPQLANLIADRQRQIADADEIANRLRSQIAARETQLGQGDADVTQAQQDAAAQLAAAGFSAVRGPGLSVSLNDAPRQPDGQLPRGANPDDVVVHQQDVQAVVNALWAGGAEAMTLMGVRVISTSAVRCVGNTLLLQGRLYSPPFVITAIGDPDRLTTALDASPILVQFQRDASVWGLGYRVTPEGDVTLPAYDGSTSLIYASSVPTP